MSVLSLRALSRTAVVFFRRAAWAVCQTPPRRTRFYLSGVFVLLLVEGLGGLFVAMHVNAMTAAGVIIGETPSPSPFYLPGAHTFFPARLRPVLAGSWQNIWHYATMPAA